MISDDTRLEVAERLRELPRYADADGCCTEWDVLFALGLKRRDAIGFVRADDAQRLADLIDLTCAIVRPATPDKFGVCSACGALVNMMDSVANATNYLKPRYCPNCGARVVRPNGD